MENGYAEFFDSRQASCPEAVAMSESKSKTPAAAAPTEDQPNPDLPLQERCPERLSRPCGALVWLLCPDVAVGELFLGRAWLALSFLLVRW